MIKNNIDYNLIRDMELLANDLFEWLELNVIDGIGEFKDRRIRIIGNDSNTIQVSIPIKDFDRWSNSVEIEYNLNIKSERDAFIHYIEKES